MRRSGSITVKRARVSLEPTEVETLVLHPDNPTRHVRHKANSIGSGHATTSPDYLQDVVESVADAGPVLITGPANAKTELASTFTFTTLKRFPPNLNRRDSQRVKDERIFVH
jgi:hypothetical protein